MRYHSLSLFLFIAALVFAACSVPAAENLPATAQPTNPPTAQPTLPPTAAPTTAPTPSSPTQIFPAPITDLDEFKAALLPAIMAQDAETLLVWMTEPFLGGGWRADAGDYTPSEALRLLYSDYLTPESRLEWVPDADLTALLGGIDPLAFPRPEMGVIDAALVSGWGQDGRDEAVLFISRAADNTLQWHGWMILKGGISGARYGGVQPYANDTYGYSFFVPKGFEIADDIPESVTVMAPGEGHPGEERAAAIVYVEPANGRTVQEITEQFKADLGPGYEIPPGTAMGLDKAFAIVLSGLPGQDSNRRLFVVYNDVLYTIYFVPDLPALGETYWQMEDLYAVIVNTFHFTE